MTMRPNENEKPDGGNRNVAICSPETLSFMMDTSNLSPNGLLDLLIMRNTNASPKMPVMPTISGDDNPYSISQVECFYQCGETSTMSGHKRNRPEKETLSEVQPTEMQNNNPEGQATVEAIVGNNIPISFTVHDAVDPPPHVVVQPALEPISTQTSNSVSSIENAKLIFNDLIALSLKDLINPENETSMKNALSILKTHCSLFSEQAVQILELSVEFPVLVLKWRAYSQFLMESQKSSAEKEKIRDLVKNSERDEEILKAKYEELENKEKELMTQLEAVQKEKAEIAEKRTETYKKEQLMRITTTSLKKLADQWVELQSFFV